MCIRDRGYPVRLVGQDSGRGTFSQRHSVLRNQVDNSRYIPLNNISDNQKNFEIVFERIVFPNFHRNDCKISLFEESWILQTSSCLENIFEVLKHHLRHHTILYSHFRPR